MNYKRIVELKELEDKDPNSDKFYTCFLECIKRTQLLSSQWKQYKNSNERFKVTVRRQIISNLETLSCFASCSTNNRPIVHDILEDRPTSIKVARSLCK